MQGKDVDFQQKLILRLQHLCQLETLLKAALCHAPARLSLPTSMGNIMPFADICSVCPWTLVHRVQRFGCCEARVKGNLDWHAGEKEKDRQQQ